MPRKKKPQTKADAQRVTAHARRRRQETEMPESKDKPEEKAQPAGPEKVSCQCGWTGTKEEAERHFYNAPSGHQKT